jgi:hypothetical protein
MISIIENKHLKRLFALKDQVGSLEKGVWRMLLVVWIRALT